MKALKKLLKVIIGIVLAIVLFFAVWFVILFVQNMNRANNIRKKLANDVISEKMSEVEEEEDKEAKVQNENPKATREEILAKYKAYLEPANDEYDYAWASDNELQNTLHYLYIRDAKAYERAFGYSKPTKEQLYVVIETNNKINDKYKKYFKEFVDLWLTKYPDSDLSIFYYNLRTIEVKEMSEHDLAREALSTSTLALYNNMKNYIVVKQGINLDDKTSNDYIIMTHETLHAVRTCVTKDNGQKEHISARFWADSDMGTYTDEVVDTYFTYQVLGLNRNLEFYLLQSSVYRQIIPYMDYDGNDYVNHSVNYFIDKMKPVLKEAGIEQDAYYVLLLIESQGKTRYRSNLDQVFGTEDFKELYQIISKLYKYHHKDEGKSDEELFEEFYKDITFKYEDITVYYPEMTKEMLKEAWNKSAE